LWTGRFDDARNASLEAAKEAGADWSMMVDADERLEYRDASAVRGYLASLPEKACIVCAHAGDYGYQRERFFRGNIKQRWKFRTHESIDAADGEQVTVAGDIIRWHELPKTGAQVTTKSERDLALIDEDLKDHPGEPRILFYRGNTLAHLGRFQEAIDEYRKVADVGIGEATAWACYCAARLYFEMANAIAQKYLRQGKEIPPDSDDMREVHRLMHKALDCCAAGVHRETRVAELHWLRGTILHGMGRHEEGLAWLEQAKVHGWGSRGHSVRHGFMLPHALKDGPDFVIQMCLKSIAARDAPKPEFVPFVADESDPQALSQRIEPGAKSEAKVTVTGTGAGSKIRSEGEC
jgi:tetratricopeptide (TPR) repeat protein